MPADTMHERHAIRAAVFTANQRSRLSRLVNLDARERARFERALVMEFEAVEGEAATAHVDALAKAIHQRDRALVVIANVQDILDDDDLGPIARLGAIARQVRPPKEQ